MKSTLIVFLLCTVAVAQMPPEPSSAPKIHYSTNLLVRVKCPECERTSELRPFRVDRSIRFEVDGQRVNQYQCWYACPHQDCREIWSVTRERYADLNMVVLAETNAPSLPPTPMPTMTRMDPFSFPLEHLPPGWQANYLSLDQITPDDWLKFGTNKANIRVIVLTPPK
jgi:hypothetical protein